MSLNFAAFYKASPIVAPLLMFGAMFGMLFLVPALRNSSWGVVGRLRLHLCAGHDAGADAAVRRAASRMAGSWSRWRAA